MKKYILLRLTVVVVLTSVLLMIAGTILLFQAEAEGFKVSANLQIDRLVEILETNELTIEELRTELEVDYLIRAKAGAYIIENNPEVVDDVSELIRITELLQVDEINLFSPEGEIYSGSVPEYYGFTMQSGEQISFFLPMLDDYDLELVQEVTPNTAESKEMQYIAVWSDNRENIIQIGIEPTRLLEAMSETELGYIFNHLTPAIGTTIIAADIESGTIISSTDMSITNMDLSDIGVNVESVSSANSNIVGTTINSVDGQSVFRLVDEVLIGVNSTNATIYQNAFSNMFIIIACGVIIGALIITLLFHMLDKVVLKGFYELNNSLNRVAAGDLQHRLTVSNLPEFSTISTNVNLMISSVVESSRKFSTIFQYVNLPLALYEHRSDIIVVTSKMSEILTLTAQGPESKTVDTKEFLALINNIMDKPYSNERDVFIYEDGDSLKYLKIKLYSEQTSNWGIVFDVTEEVKEKQNIKFERDIDFLTNIYNRRAFLEELDNLSNNSEKLKKAVVSMMDLDNLKYVNDSWGHIYGDAFICKAAEVLQEFQHDNKLIARLSGDEFIILLYGEDSYEELEKQMRVLENDFKNAYISTPEHDTYAVTISGGYALYPQQSTNFKEILNFADKAMYEVKRNNKGHFTKYQDETPNTTITP